MRVNEDCRKSKGYGSFEVESRCGLLLQIHCCQPSPSSAFDAVKAVTVLGAKSVNRYFLNICSGCCRMRTEMAEIFRNFRVVRFL